ncbi:DUF6961 family protein [Sphingobium yanoikuyae]|uniref:DUF6961 family protein n=1 Tax=Sphingobium yanoikuyae TaxID=13690 RepID=UPI0022DE06F2|nr:hypothetical protein [Sphingobium yanoikuyae]WBQ19279.1 hypothetical protein PAE53_23070 [Sphingobium yanoikuyae]
MLFLIRMKKGLISLTSPSLPISAKDGDPDLELCGMVSMLLRPHGERAPVVAAERKGRLASEGKFEGVELWCQMAFRLDRIILAKAAT